MSDAVLDSIDTTRAAVASQWQLVWWAFRRHRLAMIGLVMTVAFYIVALVPGFFAINDPSQQNPRAAYRPPAALHFIATADDGSWSFGPYIHASVLKRDPQTLETVFVDDPTRKIPLHFFAPGYEYSVFGLFSTHIHLLASDNPR